MQARKSLFDSGVDLLDAAGPGGDDAELRRRQRGDDRADLAMFELSAQAAKFFLFGEKIILAQVKVIGGHGPVLFSGKDKCGQFAETVFFIIGVFGIVSQQVVEQVAAPDGVVGEEGQAVAAGKAGENSFFTFYL